MSLEPSEFFSLWRGRMRSFSAVAVRGSVAPMRETAELICSRYGITMQELCGPSRQRRHVRPRQAFMCAAYSLGNVSLTQVGRFLGGRDHTTVLAGVRRHRARTETPDLIVWDCLGGRK